MAAINPNFDSTFTLLDPKSLILSQFNSDDNLLRLTTGTFLERGPRYKAYADLRESKLRLKMKSPPFDHETTTVTPPRKLVKFQGSLIPQPPRRKASSFVAQSVPDFSEVLRKENRKPAAPVMEKSVTPPAGSKSMKMYGVGANSFGSKSVNALEKRSGGLMARKSFASVEELKGLSCAAANAINNGGGESRAARFRRTILGYKQ